MSALAKRVQRELLFAMRELTGLRIKAAHVNKRVNMAYQEGFERGAAHTEEARVLADNRQTEIISLRVALDCALDAMDGYVERADRGSQLSFVDYNRFMQILVENGRRQWEVSNG